MNLKKIANQVRYNPQFSFVASRLAFPIQRASALIDQQLRRKIWLNGGTVSYDGFPIHFPRNVGFNYISGIYWQGLDGYEPEMWRVMRHYLKTARHFLDVGSNIGFYAVLAKKINPALTVDAFEPVPALYEKNILFQKANGITAPRLWQMAVSDTNGEATLALPIEAAGTEDEATGTLRADAWQFRWGNRQEFVVKTITLDTFLQDKNLTPLFLKIDVEDFEAAVLRGGRATFLQRRPTAVCEILTREHGNAETIAALHEYNYAVFGISRDGVFRMADADFETERPFTNFLLLPNEQVGPSTNFLSWEKMDIIVPSS